MLRQENVYVGVYGVIIMNNDNCKLAEISARCVQRGNNCLNVQKQEKLAEISARPPKNQNISA